MRPAPHEPCIAGVGMTPFGRHASRSLARLGAQACLEAVRDAGLEFSKIEAIYCGSALGALVHGVLLFSVPKVTVRFASNGAAADP